VHKAELSIRFEQGPFGRIAVYRIPGSHDVVLHSLDVLQNHIIPLMLPVYFREQLGSRQICIDCTGLLLLCDVKNDNWASVPQKKSAVADFLRTITEAEDHFISLESFIIDPDYIFFDPLSRELKWCSIPLQPLSKDKAENVDALPYEALELLLMDPFFEDVFEENDRNQIICMLRDHRDQDFLEYLDAIDAKESTVTPRVKWTNSFAFYLVILMIVMITVLTAYVFLRGTLSALSSPGRLAGWYVILFGSILAALITFFHSAPAKSLNTPQVKHSGNHILSLKEIYFPSICIPSQGYKECEHKPLHSPAFLTLTSEQQENDHIQKRAVVWVDDYLIGSDRTLCDLFLDDRSVSDRHARIIRRDPLFFLMDIGSQQGTCIGNRRLYSFEESPLRNGDAVSFGKIKYMFTEEPMHTATDQKG
jgi:hypothetical protein